MTSKTDARRPQQRLRTRKALLAAARELIAANRPVTVVGAAEAGGISKATAYRYFPTSDALVREALLDAKWLSPEEVVGDALKVEDRIMRVARFLFDYTRQNEPMHRLLLAKALEDSASEEAYASRDRRGARRLPMIEFALEPVRDRLEPTVFDALVLKLAVVLGIEGYVAFKDVCKVDDGMADRLAREIVSAILTATPGLSTG